MKYEYDTGQFSWSKDKNTFYAEAWNLAAMLPDGSMHPEAFPNQKRQFYIVNPKTGNQRRFRFVKEQTNEMPLNEMEAIGTYKSWIFKSEDDIFCDIMITA